MRHTLTIVVFSFLCYACGAGAEDAQAATKADEQPQVPATKQVSPPPPVCVYLTEATVLSYFAAEVQLPMPGRRSAAEYASCQYDLEAPGWSAALIVELPEPGSKQQAIIDEVAGAKGTNKVQIGEAAGRFENDGRIFSVSGTKHFRVKFSALPKAGFEAPFSAAERRELLTKIAASVLAV